MNNMTNNENIIKKVRGLLALSRDHKSDEESQSAFLKAQKLMIKYQLSDLDVGDYEADEILRTMAKVHVTVPKKLFWWERQLANIIARNFRCKNFITSTYMKKRVTFFGYGGDLELAKEMYILAYEVILQHSKDYVKAFYKETGIDRDRYYTESVKVSYMNGFLDGLDDRFKEQVAMLRQDYPLMVLVPEEVENAYMEMSEDWGNTKFSIPNATVARAYDTGKQEAKAVDFTRSTIGE